MRQANGKNNEVNKLLLEIAKCSIAMEILDGNSFHGCSEIVNYSVNKCGIFHLPEPWNGDIENAPILFVSSNPSIDCNEYYPDLTWNDEKIVDFFTNRFTKYIQNGTHPMLKNGTFRRRHTQFWAIIKSQAAVLLNKTKEDVVPGKDFAITEIVHCKSEKEYGVDSALPVCSERYLRRIFDIAGARVIIILGAKAQKVIKKMFKLQPIEGKLWRLEDKLILFFPHPAAFGDKNPEKILGSYIKEVQDILSE